MRKILVPIKRVIDYAQKIRVDPSKGAQGVQLKNVKSKSLIVLIVLSLRSNTHNTIRFSEYESFL